jgi:hypothetical protein
MKSEIVVGASAAGRAMLRAAALAALVVAMPLPAAAQPAAPAPKSPPAKSAAQPPPVKPSEGESYRLDGFRSASFGMTEQQVRSAIRKDFNLGGDKVKLEENAVERTTLLTITVPDLLPDAGPARIHYVLGFKSKRLVQVNLLWGTPVAAGAKPEKLRSAAEALGQYFLGLGFPRESVIANAQAKDGTLVVFQGADQRKRTVVLRFAESAAAEGGPPAAMMALFYIMDPERPDVFRIARGEF